MDFFQLHPALPGRTGSVSGTANHNPTSEAQETCPDARSLISSGHVIARDRWDRSAPFGKFCRKTLLACLPLTEKRFRPDVHQLCFQQSRKAVCLRVGRGTHEMLAFITTLRHPQNSADYGRVESQLQDTLASITRQSSDDYVVMLVGNRRPGFPLPEHTVFVEVDFPPPSDHKGPQTGPAAGIWDKSTKTAIGLAAARDFEPEYVMPVDADET
jgi:hypothetical protein